MTKSKNPPPTLGCYDDLAGSLDYALQLLARGVADRRAPFHTPSVATLGLDGTPRVRTVVLRSYDLEQRQLRFHTDQRSTKIAEIMANPRGAMLFYDAGQKIQLRVACQFSLPKGTSWQTAWDATAPMSRECYQVDQPPGTPIESPELARFDAAATEDGAINFQPVLAKIETIEWLYLAASGHRRAYFDFQGATPLMQWLVP
jgi:pyridoxamine 5'-phosphate oxidase